MSKHITSEIDAKKDTYYRFLNNERFNWRKLIYKLTTEVIALADQTPLQRKVIIQMIPSAINTAKKWNWSAIISITKRTTTHWANSVCRSAIITESCSSPWMRLFTHPWNARTSICAGLISGPAAGKDDRKP
jgi:hypothetical protein